MLKHSKITSDVRDPPCGYPCWQSVLASENANFYLYKPCVMFFIWLLSHLLQSGSEPRPSLSLRVGPCLSLACQDVSEPDPLVVVEWIYLYGPFYRIGAKSGWKYFENLYVLFPKLYPYIYCTISKVHISSKWTVNFYIVFSECVFPLPEIVTTET